MATACRDLGSSPGILQAQVQVEGVAISPLIDASMRNGAGSTCRVIPGKGRAFGGGTRWAAHRCSIHQQRAYTVAHATVVPSPTIRNSTNSRM